MPRTWWLLATAIAVAIVLSSGILTVVRVLGTPISVLILGFTVAAALEPVVPTSRCLGGSAGSGGEPF